MKKGVVKSFRRLGMNSLIITIIYSKNTAKDVTSFTQSKTTLEPMQIA